MHLSPAALDSPIRLLDVPQTGLQRGDILDTGTASDVKSNGQYDLIGVGDGYRTRDLLSHSQAFCH